MDGDFPIFNTGLEASLFQTMRKGTELEKCGGQQFMGHTWERRILAHTSQVPAQSHDRGKLEVPREKGRTDFGLQPPGLRWTFSDLKCITILFKIMNTIKCEKIRVRSGQTELPVFNPHTQNI